MKRFVEFIVWNGVEERPATPQEIYFAVKIDAGENGKCSIEAEDGYSLLTD